jgi:dihydrofolate synthase/folylpolyglutamate synthase
MTYQETLDYLYNQRPAYERQGAGGYKPGLQTSLDLDQLFGHPHRNYRIIHVAGTNGKGSVSHMLAAMLQLSGFRVGLFTSPHFVDFRERIRVNGQMISQDEVVQFVETFLKMGYPGTPSFFEITSTMAFSYFADQHVDFAVIETGLGGRLDSTNIVTPILSVITNVSFDHTEFLGNTLSEIATEKAGIIKPGVPVVIGEADQETRPVFEETAMHVGAPIIFAQDTPEVIEAQHEGGKIIVNSARHGVITCELAGDYQCHNINTALAAERALEQLGVVMKSDVVNSSFHHIHSLTGLIGRWMTVSEEPCRTICDSGHNIAGITSVVDQLKNESYDHLHMVMGFMRDKDLQHILPLLPTDATYYYTHAHTSRAMPGDELRLLAAQFGLMGQSFPDVTAALAAARAAATHRDLIYIGGSMYLLAEFFAHTNL